MEQNVNEFNDDVSLNELFEIVKPHLLKAILIAIIFALTAFIGTKLLIKPTYQSSAIMIVNNKRNEDSQSVSNDEITSARNLAQVYSVIIKSDAVMQIAATKIGDGITAEEIAKKVSVTSVNNTQLLQVSVKDHNPVFAQQIANEIVTVAPPVLDEMVSAGNAKIVTYPQIPNNPIAPNTKMITIIGGTFGFIMVLGYVLLRNLLDRTFKTTDDIEKELGLPVLGVIPNISGVKK